MKTNELKGLVDVKVEDVKEIFLVKQVHASCSSFSSNDVWLYKVITSFSEETLCDFLVNNEFQQWKQYLKVYVAEDKTFYNASAPLSSYGRTPEFKKLIEAYIAQGWLKELPEEVDKAYKEKHALDMKKHYKERKRNGFVLHKPFEELLPSDYHGGFSKKLLEISVLRDYIKDGKSVWGYMGHQCRTKVLDKQLEKIALSVKLSPQMKSTNEELIASWLISTDARHFSDNLEGLEIWEQTNKLKKNINRMLNLGFIYSRKEHEDTYESREKLEEVYAKVLLPEE